LNEARKKIVSKTSTAIQGVAQVGTDLGMSEVAKRLNEIEKLLHSETFKVIVLGRFKNGKSTVMNALLGKLTHPVSDLPPGKGPMPTDDLPCTATLASIRYSEKPYVKAWKTDGKYDPWTLTDFLKKGTVKDDE